eukprot:s2021_g9.t1
MNIPLNSAFRNLGQEGVLLTPMASFMWAWPDGIPTNAPFGGVMYGPQTTVPLKLPFTEYCSDNDVGQKKARVWWALRRTRRRRSLPWILHFLAFRDSDADDDAGPGVEEVQAAVERADAAGAPAAGKAFLRCPLSDLALLVAYAARNSLPVASWLARHGIQTLVLRYRLLPHYDHQDALSDLEAAVQLVRKHKDGPVAAIGFSAGGHLVASLSLRLKKTPLDAQVLVYPAIDGSDWAKPGSAGFWDPACNKNTDKLLEGQQALLGGRGFAAPPSFIVGSTGDAVCPAKAHTDPYVAALRKRGIAHEYVRGNLGEHGFGLDKCWSNACAAWLQQRGFGKKIAQRSWAGCRLLQPMSTVCKWDTTLKRRQVVDATNGNSMPKEHLGQLTKLILIFRFSDLKMTGPTRRHGISCDVVQWRWLKSQRSAAVSSLCSSSRLVQR